MNDYAIDALATLRAAPMPVVCLKHGHLAWANEAALSLFPTLDSTPLSFLDFIAQSGRFSVSQLLDNALLTGSLPRGSFLLRQLTKDPSLRPSIVYRCDAVYDAGRMVVSLFFTNDSSQQYEQQQGRESRQYFESVANTTGFFIVRVNMQGQYSFANESFLRTFGVSAAKLMNTSVESTIHPEDHEACNAAAHKCMAHPEKPVYVLLRKPLASGKYIATQWEFKLVVDAAGQPFEIQSTGIRIHDAATDSFDWMARRTQVLSILENISRATELLMKTPAGNAETQRLIDKLKTQKLLMESMRFDADVMPVLPIA